MSEIDTVEIPILPVLPQHQRCGDLTRVLKENESLHTETLAKSLRLWHKTALSESAKIIKVTVDTFRYPIITRWNVVLRSGALSSAISCGIAAKRETTFGNSVARLISAGVDETAEIQGCHGDVSAMASANSAVASRSYEVLRGLMSSEDLLHGLGETTQPEDADHLVGHDCAG